MPITAPRLPGTVSGFSMIEVLVSFLVLAAGLLGVATIQQRGMDNSHGAYLRTQAGSLAQDMASRVRANRTAFENGSYDKPENTSKPSCYTTSFCSSADMAANDNFDWQQSLAQQLPAGEGVVCLDSTPNDGTSAADNGCDGSGGLLAVKVWWDGPNKDGTVDQLYVITVLP